MKKLGEAEVAFHFFSDCIDLDFFFAIIAAGSRLHAVWARYGCGKAASVHVPTQEQAMLKSEQHQIIELTVKQDVVQQDRICKG